MTLHIVVLAAGQGTRMKSRQPKVLQTLAGQPLLGHVLAAARQLDPDAIHVVYGHRGDLVRQAFADEGVRWVEQAEQLGTGHAVDQAMPGIPDEATVLVLYGDVPLIRPATLRALAAAATEGLALLTVTLDDPNGYGRILRNAEGAVEAIVEQKDASPEQLAVTEVNTGFLAAPAHMLRGWLQALDCKNAQGEYYLTDCVAASVAQGGVVEAVTTSDIIETLGVNDRVQLAQLERRHQLRQADALLRAGLTLLDPARFDLRGTLTHGPDCVVDVNCVFLGQVELGEGVQIGPHCVLENVVLGDGVRVEANCHLSGARVGASAQVGPYARLRPGTTLGAEAKVGNFVETKNAQVGVGSKINHLSYVGDAELGQDVNIGAGTITCNYDGANKHRTVINDGAFIGSNSALVAPVTIGAGATIGAGSTISRDAPAGELTVARGRQKSLAGWKRPMKGDKPG